MTPVPMEVGYLFAAALLLLGLFGVLARRNIIFILLSLEIMFNAAGVGFIVGGAQWRQPDGQIMFLFILAVTATEVAVGLALVLRQRHLWKNLDADAASTMKGEPWHSR